MHWHAQALTLLHIPGSTEPSSLLHRLDFLTRALAMKQHTINQLPNDGPVMYKAGRPYMTTGIGQAPAFASFCR